MAVTPDARPVQSLMQRSGRADMTALMQRSGRADGARIDNGATITADLWPHGLTAAGRETRVCALPAGATVAELVAREWPGASVDPRAFGASVDPRAFGATPIAVAVDGRAVPRAAWAETTLRGGEVVTLRTRLAGGDDKNPLAIVFQVAILIAAIYFPPLLQLNAFWTAAATAAIVIGGTLIGNALFPVRQPESPVLPGSPSTAPLYSLTGGGNRARPYEPLLLVLGTHRLFPDLAAAAYTEVADDEQYLHQIFHFGLGDLEIDQLRIGATPLASYDEVETEWGDAQGRIALVAGNVDSELGAALEDTEWVERVTGPGTRRIGIDLTGRVFRVYDQGDTGTGGHTGFPGAAYAVAIQALAAQNNGLLHHQVTVEIELEAEDGTVARHNVAIGGNTSDVLRGTDNFDVSPGRYTVRVRRTTPPSGNSRIYDDVVWAALRAYQADEADYSGQTRLGLRIRASGQLSGRLDRLSALVRQKVPTWDGAAWTAPVASSNPAWLFRWYARGLRVRGRLVAGVGLPDTRIDEASIVAWGAWCEAQGLGCNHVLDRATTHADVLTLVAQCGRASPTWQTGRLGVVWEDRGRPATALITPGNIVAGTFGVEYAAGRAADEIAVRYIEPELDWQYNTLRRRVPGAAGEPGDPRASGEPGDPRASGATVTATITLQGITDATQAAVECNLQAARQVYHRRRFGWEMAAEGLSITRGDVVHITHSLIDGGTAGRLAGGTAGRVTLNRAVDPGDGGALMLFRLPDGRVHQSAVSRPPGIAGETAEIDLAAPLPEAPDADGASPLDTLWRLYDTDAPPVRARIIAVEPATDRRVRFVAIDEVDAYHAAAHSDLTAPFPALVARPPRVLAVAFAENLVRVGAGFAVELQAVLTVAGDWRGGVVRAAVNGGPARIVARLVDGETDARWLAPPAGTLTVTVAPGTEAAPSGAPFTAHYEITGFLAPPLAPSNFLIDVLGDGTRRLRWTPPPDPDLAGIVIRYAEPRDGDAPGSRGTRAEPTWDDMEPLHRGHLTASPYETVEPPPGHWIFAARAVDTGGRYSEEEVRIVAEIGPQRLGDALVWRCPASQGWPGTITGAVRSDDGRDALEAPAAYTWDDLTTWDAWESWATGKGAGAATGIAFAAEAVDIGIAIDKALRWAADSVGAVAFEYRIAATEAALADADWTAYVPGTTVGGRWLQLRWRVTGDGSEVLSLDHLCWSVHAPSAERKLLDRNTAEWEGTAADGREVPVDLGLVTDIHVTLQSVGAGWSWTLANKNDPTRIKIFDGDGNPADAVVDAVVRGIAA